MTEETEEISKEIMRDLADFIFTKSQENIVSMKISDTGALLISGEIKEEGGKIVIEYTAPYASAVNDGTDKHFVDPEELLGWVQRKLSVPSKDVLKVAGKIAAKIRRFGTDPKPFMTNAIEIAKVKYKGVVDLTR